MLSKEQIDRIDELGLAAANDMRAGVAFMNAAHPRAVRELIAMLRDAQEDAARYHKWRKETASDNGYSEEYVGQTLDAAIQRCCDGAHHAGAGNVCDYT